MFVITLVLLGLPACSDEKKPAAPAPPAEPYSRGRGEECVKPDDCQEGLWCLNGRCKEPLNRGMRKKQEMEQMQDERYENMDDKVKSIEDKMLR